MTEWIAPAVYVTKEVVSLCKSDATNKETQQLKIENAELKAIKKTEEDAKKNIDAQTLAYQSMVEKIVASSTQTIADISKEKASLIKSYETAISNGQNTSADVQKKLSEDFKESIQKKDDAIAKEREAQQSRLDKMAKDHDDKMKEFYNKVQELNAGRLEDEKSHGKTVSEIQTLHRNDVKAHGEEKCRLEREMRHIQVGGAQSNFKNSTEFGHKFLVSYSAEQHAKPINDNHASINTCMSRIKGLQKQLNDQVVKRVVNKNKNIERSNKTEVCVAVRKICESMKEEATQMDVIIRDTISQLNKPGLEEAIVEKAKILLLSIQSKSYDAEKEICNAELAFAADKVESPNCLDGLVNCISDIDQTINNFPRLMEKSVPECIAESLRTTAIKYRDDMDAIGASAKAGIAAVQNDGNLAIEGETTPTVEEP